MLDYRHCTLCPRRCGVDRTAGQLGFCRMPDQIHAARAALHYWEEPVISGSYGSGAVFFSGCTLRCAFCQNGVISQENFGKPLSPAGLRAAFERLIDEGCQNINLVTPTHFLPSILPALTPKLPVPVVYNCGGYESVETLRQLEGLVDIALDSLQAAVLLPFCPVIVVAAVFLFDKAFNLCLQGFIARQLGNAVLPEIAGGCVCYDKVTFMLLTVGCFCFGVFLLFQPVPDRAGLGIGKHLPLQLLFPVQRLFHLLQPRKAFLHGGIGGRTGCVQFIRGKAVLLHSGNGSRHLFEIVDSRPTVIADTFSLGSLRRTVNHSLNVACRGDFLRFSSLCAVCFSGMVFGYGYGLFGGSVGVLLQKSKNSSTVKIISQFSGGNGFRSVRGKVGQSPSALFDGHALLQK